MKPRRFSDKKCQDTILTYREIEILRLLANGKTIHQVADELFISHHTVQSHKKNLMVKLDAKNSFQLGMRTAELSIS